MNTNSKFSVGQVTTAQLGNPGESGYRANCSVEVVGVRDDVLGRPVYLVRPVGVVNFLAVAIISPTWLDEEIKGNLYSTDGREFGAGTRGGDVFGFLTEEQARRSLGF